jgi:hypothetical protein
MYVDGNDINGSEANTKVIVKRDYKRSTVVIKYSMYKEKHQELERPCKFHKINGKQSQPKEDKLKTSRESDQSIVLR